MKVEHKVLKIINDPHYLEHDAYFLFDSIMINMWEWYYVSDVRDGIHQLLNIILKLRILVLLLVSTLPYVVRVINRS
jgi:hypothetical protein